MKKHIPFLLILAIGIGLRLWWWVYTSYTAEDAFITFQFARQISERNEFAFNPGQPIYGTTTPLLTLLLSLWYEFNTDLALGAKVIALLAFGGGLTFLYLSLKGPARLIAPLLIAISVRLIAEDMSGMEMSLLFFFMCGAMRGLTLKEPWLSGLMCGFLLWTRVDTILFVGVMALAHYLDNKPLLPFLGGTLIYLPWIAFAWYYFGSPIPFTVIAKEVAYGINSPPALVHLDRITDYLSIPFAFATSLAMYFTRRRTFFLSLFILLETAFLVFTGETVFPRYFYMLTLVSLIVIALTISRVGEIHPLVPLLLVLCVLFSNQNQVEYYRSVQAGRQAELQKIGLWFHENTPPLATIMLEPLGYVGYGAQRVILDEVGLITPVVVEFHRQNVKWQDFTPFLNPDYVLLQCHQADHVEGAFPLHYNKLRTFSDGTFRGCYDVWKRK